MSLKLGVRFLKTRAQINEMPSAWTAAILAESAASAAAMSPLQPIKQKGFADIKTRSLK